MGRQGKAVVSDVLCLVRAEALSASNGDLVEQVEAALSRCEAASQGVTEFLYGFVRSTVRSTLEDRVHELIEAKSYDSARRLLVESRKVWTSSSFYVDIADRITEHAMRLTHGRDARLAVRLRDTLRYERSHRVPLDLQELLTVAVSAGDRRQALLLVQRMEEYWTSETAFRLFSWTVSEWNFRGFDDGVKETECTEAENLLLWALDEEPLASTWLAYSRLLAWQRRWNEANEALTYAASDQEWPRLAEACGLSGGAEGIRRTALHELIVRGNRDYIVRGDVGRGGLAIVVKVERLEEGWQHGFSIREREPRGPLFAAKVLSGHRFEITGSVITRFLREAEILLSLEHPHLIKAIDYGRWREHPVIVVELCTGGTLYGRLGYKVPPIVDALSWARQLLDAVAYLHEHEIVHRDITPKNIFFRADGQLVLGDLGLARPLDADRITSTSETFGSLLYISAQQRERPLTADRSDDVFSVGQVMFHLLTGIVPHGGTGAVIDHRPDCPIAISKLVDTLRSYHRDQRPQYAALARQLFKEAMEVTM